MTLAVVAVLALAGGFVAGILVGRRNTKKVEADIALIKTEVSKLTGGKVNL